MRGTRDDLGTAGHRDVQYSSHFRMPLRDNWFQIFLVFPLCFAVAVLCGMAISRGLTAAVIALVMTLALAVPQYI